MKFQSKPIAEHSEVPLADDGRLEDVITHWQQQSCKKAQSNNENSYQNSSGKSCYTITLMSPGDIHPEGKESEILGLIKALGDHIVGHEVYHLKKPHPKTLIGRGAIEEIARRAREVDADMLILDAWLTPSQARNLEFMTGMAISDREAVILNVFLKHAKTRSARIQVELAQLEYLRPRIRGLGLNMDQQAGGILGGRGPGETASELMCRRIDIRITQLTQAVQSLGKTKRNQRESRLNCKRICLVGYTNAGKTSLMNALTSSELSSRNLPFETLDTTTRALARQTPMDVLLSDTVGFIRNLPKRLLASFTSTLNEIIEADLLVIVVDASDPERELQISTTENQLAVLKAELIPRFYLFNKQDKMPTPLSDEQYRILSDGHPYIVLSSFNSEAILSLRVALLAKVLNELKVSTLFVPYAYTETVREIYAKCKVIDVQSNECGFNFTLQGDASILEKLTSDCEGFQL